MAVEYRWAHGENERLPVLAADLVHRQVAVIAAFGPPAAVAAKAASATIPIVFMAGTDPIDLGLVTSFRRPTGNVTGLNVFAEVLTPKRQELLHDLVPNAPLIAMLVNSTAAQTRSEVRDVRPPPTSSGSPCASSTWAAIGRSTRRSPPSSISGSVGCSCKPTSSLRFGAINSYC